MEGHSLHHDVILITTNLAWQEMTEWQVMPVRNGDVLAINSDRSKSAHAAVNAR